MPKVAAVQFTPVFGQKQENLRRLAALVIQAAGNGAHLVVLPELATVGYSFMSPAEVKPLAEQLLPLPNDEQPPDTSVQIMYRLASQLNVHIAWGLIEQDVGTGHFFNTQMLLCPDGSFESYRKVNLWGNDILWAHEGRGNPPVLTCDLGGATTKVGLLICRDVRDKKDDDWKSFYQKGDADIVAYSANWGDGGFPANAWMDFVKENLATLIVANRYGEEGLKPNKFGGGGTCIIKMEKNDDHPNGVYCDGLVWNQDCIVYADV
jgi:predicted amidohydrolase